ncbi:MAG: addiction module antidote protein HigA family [Parcubacteria group bacterium]|nr:addiction module antidote protein HigA family [Parcubacteria group bacterium]
MILEKYTYKPNIPVPPGETLLEILQFLKMSQKELAERMGRPLKLINEIIKAKAAITTETALQLERVLGKEAAFWLQLEAGYQEALARQAEKEQLGSEIAKAEAYPYNEMVKNGWIENAATSFNRTQNILSFFAVNSILNIFEKRLLEPVAYKVSTRKKVDNHALEAWLRKGTIDAQQMEVSTFNKLGLEQKVPLLRNLIVQKDPNIIVREITRHLSEVGVSFVMTKGLTNVPVNGAARWLGGDKALIQLSLYGKMADKFWFSLFHEIAHILYHGKRFASIDLEGDKAGSSVIETEADEYSRNVLIPLDKYQKFLLKNEFTDSAIKAFAQSVKVEPGIVVGRLQYEEIIPYSKGNHLKTSYSFKD